MATADRSRGHDQNAPVVLIVERLRASGITEIRAATSTVWIVGRAPSGALMELYWWPDQGYYVSRSATEDGPLERLGHFLSWEDAVDCALQA
jgi:hypothetical protein